MFYVPIAKTPVRFLALIYATKPSNLILKLISMKVLNDFLSIFSTITLLDWLTRFWTTIFLLYPLRIWTANTSFFSSTLYQGFQKHWCTSDRHVWKSKIQNVPNCSDLQKTCKLMILWTFLKCKYSKFVGEKLRTFCTYCEKITAQITIITHFWPFILKFYIQNEPKIGCMVCIYFCQSRAMTSPSLEFLGYQLSISPQCGRMRDLYSCFVRLNDID